MREEVEVLKDHSHFRADLLNVLYVVGELDAVDDDPAPLMLFQTVDAPDERGFPRAGGTADDDAFLLVERQVDALEHVEFTEPFVQIGDFDHRRS